MRSVLASLCSSLLVVGLAATAAPASAATTHRPGKISLSGSSVAEDATRGTVVGDLSAPDADRGFRHAFRLVSGRGDDDNALFRIRGRHLEVAGPLDFETDPDLTVRVRVTDRSGRTREGRFGIQVRDVADQPPAGVLLSRASVDENRPAGTVVGALSTTDPYAPRTFGYRIVGGPDAADFTVAGGQLMTTRPLDHEAAATRTVRVESSTASGDAVAADLTIAVADVNEAPTAVTLAPDSTPEGLVNEVVGTLSASDPDFGDTHTFALVGGAGSTDNGSFSVDGDLLRTAVPLDYESHPTYQVRVRVTDAGGASFEAPLTVRTIESPTPGPTLANLRLTHDRVDENSPIGTVVGEAVADGSGVTYTLVDGCGPSVRRASCRAAPTYFTLSAAGVLKTGNYPFDHEARTNTYAVTIRATDAGGASIEETFPIVIDDVNEAPTSIGLDNAVVPARTSSMIGHLSAVDPDAGDTVVFTVVSATDSVPGEDATGIFSVQNGNELTSRSCGFGPDTYTVTVRATDAGGLFVDVPLTVTATSTARMAGRRC